MVQAPNGQQISVIVPPGLAPGMFFVVEAPSAGTPSDVNASVPVQLPNGVVPRADQTGLKEPPQLCCKVLFPICAVYCHEGCSPSCAVACGAGCFGWFPAIAYTVLYWEPQTILAAGANDMER